MEDKLRSLFDFQKFIVDERLQDVIDGVERRVRRIQLSDEELDYVAAAGSPYANLKEDVTDNI